MAESFALREDVMVLGANFAKSYILKDGKLLSVRNPGAAVVRNFY